MVKFIWPMHSPDKGGSHLKRGWVCWGGGGKLNSTPFGVTLALKYCVISCHVTELQIPIDWNYVDCDAILQWKSPSATVK
jgi:hypothetical protein